MSYTPPESENFLEDLLKRKEFFSLKIDPEYNFRDPPDAIDDSGYLKVHSHQLFIRNFLSPNTPNRRLHALHGCHGIDTKILMFNGEIKYVQDIVPGDTLMGDDSKPRNVQSLITGNDKMYNVKLENGFVFKCNLHHIITVVFNKDIADKNNLPPILDISISKFFCLPQHIQKEARMYKVPVEFPDEKVECHPYEHARYLAATQKNIPKNYIVNSKEKRLELLAGFIEDIGKVKYNHIVLHPYNNKIYTDLIFLCETLGFYVQSNKKLIKIYGKGLRMIPCKVKCNGSYHNLKYKFKLIPLDHDKYYGFEIDGNHRYLLANFLVTHNTGTGKSLVALVTANLYNELYSKNYSILAAKMQAGRKNYGELDKMTPSIFVLGFGGTKTAFIRDLLKYSEFGFISNTERHELIKRQRMAATGLPDDIRYLKEFYAFLKKRIVNKSKNGFFKFYGYDEFVNRLFISDTIKFIDLETMVMQRSKTGEVITLEDIIYENIENGIIRINDQLLESFENSILICDEIHNTYNMNMKNNRGVAIQFLLDSVKNLRFLSLSATPINNSPTEVVELINYLVPKDKKITKKDFFISSKKLHPGKLNEIGELTKGHISFLQDMNIKYFPKKKFIGTKIVLDRDIINFTQGSELPYLKFIKCPMSSLHQKTLNHYLRERKEYILSKNQQATDVVESEYHIIPTDGNAILDGVFPNPDTTEYGLFKSGEIKSKIFMAPQEWKDKNKINLSKTNSTNVIVGDFLLKENIKKYSTKMFILLENIKEIILSSGSNKDAVQKIMIYHNRVETSGVILIQELLKANNMLDEFSEPVDSTICCICAKPLINHINKKEKHDFIPVRFVIAHSNIDTTTMTHSLTKYNAPINANGHNFMILLGSRIIKESYEVKDTQNLLLVSVPASIPELEQIIGRCIRKNSHINLPPEQRNVNIRVLLTVVDKDAEYLDSISPELYRYVDKLADYKIIQEIIKKLNENAIDGDIHRDIIMSQDIIKDYFPTGSPESPGANEPVEILGNLYYEPNIKIPKYKLRDLNLTTFNAYKFYEEEIRTITYIIKRLFILQRIFIYEDLWNRVREPPIGLEINPKLFLEENFVIALHNLVQVPIPILQTKKTKEMILMDQLFNASDQYIYIDGGRFKIEQVDKYYILFPVINIPTNPLNVVYIEHLENIRDKERAMIKQIVEPNDHTNADVETYMRTNNKTPGVNININDFVKESKAGINYTIAKNSFITNVQDGKINVCDFLFDFSTQFQMSFIEEAIMNKMQKKSNEIYDKVLNIMADFNVIIFYDEIKKYKDMTKQFSNGFPKIPEDTPFGYTISKSIRLFDPGNNKWFEVSKISMNRHMSFKENDIIVGYLESAEDHMKFKIRKPEQIIKKEMQEHKNIKISKSDEIGLRKINLSDTRLIEKGIVCSTKNKHELLKIAANLGISISKMNKSDIRIKKLCNLIRGALMRMEIKERKKDSRYKFLYSWWDEMITFEYI